MVILEKAYQLNLRRNGNSLNGCCECFYYFCSNYFDCFIFIGNIFSLNCTNGKFFHLQCLGLNRMPTNHKTTWRCYICRTTKKTNIAPPTTSTPATSTSATCCSPDNDDDVTVVTTGQGNQNKTGALATLTQDHFDLICIPYRWLDCNIIQQAHILLHNENLNIEGVQQPTLRPVHNFDIVSGEFVQILHTGNSHWVCVSSIGCPPGHAKLHDSFYSDPISQEIEQQTNDLLGGTLLSLLPCFNSAAK